MDDANPSWPGAQSLPQPLITLNVKLTCSDVSLDLA